MSLINFQKLKERYQADPDFPQDILETFINRMPTYIRYVQLSLLQQDIEGILCYSSQLRGIAKRCCIERLIELCVLLESQVKEEEFSDAEETFQHMQAMLKSLENTDSAHLSCLS